MRRLYARKLIARSNNGTNHSPHELLCEAVGASVRNYRGRLVGDKRVIVPRMSTSDHDVIMLFLSDPAIRSIYQADRGIFVEDRILWE